MRERARTECSGHNMPHLIAIPIPQRGPVLVEPNSLSANYLALRGGPPVSWIGVSWTVFGTSQPFHETVGEGHRCAQGGLDGLHPTLVRGQ